MWVSSAPFDGLRTGFDRLRAGSNRHGRGWEALGGGTDVARWAGMPLAHVGEEAGPASRL